MDRFNGLITALITPFDAQGRIDEEGFCALIRHQIDEGAEGLVVLGTTGEAPSLTDEEKKTLIRLARNETRDKIPLIIGTGSYSTRETIENTLQAENLGADAALIINPYYNRPTQEGLYQHFHAVAQQTRLPLIIYNHAGRCGIAMTPATLNRLLDFPTILGIKETTNQIDQLNALFELVRRKRPDFKIFSGDDASTLTFLVKGGDGVISVAANLIPAKMKQLIDSCRNGDFRTASQLHFDLYPLFHALCLETNPIPIKQAMHMTGLPAGTCRLPLTQMQDTHSLQLEAVLHALRDCAATACKL